MARGTVRLAHPVRAATCTSRSRCWRPSRNSVSIALIGGARRDEEKARAKRAHLQPPRQLRPMAAQGPAPDRGRCSTPASARRAFPRVPISNWTELDVAVHRPREHRLPPSLYYAHQRQVVERRGLLVPVTPNSRRRATARDGGTYAPCASAPWAIHHLHPPGESPAAMAADIATETLAADERARARRAWTTRPGRPADEKRKKDGYF